MTKPDSCALAIDLGTSGVKAAVIDRSGRVLGRGIAPLPFRFVAGGGAEQDAEEVWCQVARAAATAVSEAAVARDRIDGVCCTSQYSSIIPVDRAGNAVGPMLLYLDGRGAPYTAAIHRRHPEAVSVWREIHGKEPRPSGADSLAHILWFRNERPEIYARTACFLEPTDFITAKLSGEFVASQCTVFMLLLTDNRSTGVTEYDETLLGFSGLEKAKLPRLLPIDGIAGPVLAEVADKLGISRRAQVVVGTNDTQALSMGTACFSGNAIGVSFGTTTAAVSFVDAKKSDDAHFLATMPAPLTGRFLLMAENGLGAGAVRHYLERLVFADDALGSHGVADPFEHLDAAVTESQPGARGTLFLPWFSGSLAPSPNARVRGGFLNLALQTTRADMVRAALEGVALNLRWMLDACETFCGKSFSSVLFAGGGAVSSAWATILADVLDRPVQRMSDPRYVNCLGTAMLVFHRLHRVSLDELSKWIVVSQLCEPRAEHTAVYDALFEVFVRAHGHLRDLRAEI